MTKRKSPDEKATTVRKRRQAFNKTKDRATIAKSEHNEKDSVLAKLPREVREVIWRMVLGDEVLHIYQFCQVAACKLKKTPLQLFEISRSPEECFAYCGKLCRNEGFWNSLSADRKLQFQRLDRQNAFSHHDCHHSLRSDIFEHDLRKTQWGAKLSILRTCRMVYHEANRVLWTTNTFSFEENGDFSYFLSCRTSLQLQYLAKLHISFVRQTHVRHWSQALSIPTIKKLKGLREVHFYMAEISFGSYSVSDSIVRSTKLECIDFLENFRMQPLREATVIIDSANALERSRISYSDDAHMMELKKLAHSKSLAWAEALRAVLLHPDAAKNWQEEQDAKAAALARQKEVQKRFETARNASTSCSLTSSDCARRAQEKKDVKDAREGRKRRKPFVAEHCGYCHPKDGEAGKNV